MAFMSVLMDGSDPFDLLGDNRLATNTDSSRRTDSLELVEPLAADPPGIGLPGGLPVDSPIYVGDTAVIPAQQPGGQNGGNAAPGTGDCFGLPCGGQDRPISVGGAGGFPVVIDAASGVPAAVQTAVMPKCCPLVLIALGVLVYHAMREG